MLTDINTVLAAGNQDEILSLCHTIHEAKNEVDLGFVSEKLDLAPKDMTPDDLQAVAYFLSHSKATWKEVSLGEGLTDEKLRVFCDGFRGITKADVTIEKLSLNCTRMTDLLKLRFLEGVPCFSSVSVVAYVHVDVDSLTSDCDGMKVKNISEFHIPFDVVPPAVVVESLNDNAYLETFSCAIASTTVTGKAVERMLSENKSLKSLTFNIGRWLYGFILRGLACNQTLRELTILDRQSLNVMTEGDCMQFWRLLGQHKLHIASLTIESSLFPPVCGKGEAAALVEALANSISLTHVTLKYIKFNPRELKSIESGLLENRSLLELIIGDKTMPEYARFIRNKQSGNIELHVESALKGKYYESQCN